MAASTVILIGALGLPVVLLLVSVGCGLDESGTLPSFNEQVINDPSLVSYWRLDDASTASGSTAADAKDGNNGTYEGTVTQVPGLVVGDSDTAVEFDGATGYVEVPFNSNLSPSKFSVEALVKPDVAGKGTYRAVVSSLGFPQLNEGYGIYISSAEQWEFWYGDGTQWTKIAFNTTNPIFYGTTAHVVATYDGSTANLYVDHGGGAPEASAAVTIVPSTAGPLRIGAHANDATAGEFFAGVIDEVAVYNDALKDLTIQGHYAASGSG